MKHSLFLLGTILVSAPCALGQTAPVDNPVANAPLPADTKEQILSNSERVLKKSREDSAARDAKGAEVTRKLNEAIAAINAFPKPFLFTEKQIEDEKKLDQELEKLGLPMTPEEREPNSQDKEFSQQFLSANKVFDDQMTVIMELSKQLANPNLTVEQRDKLKREIAATRKERKKAIIAMCSAYKGMLEVSDRIKEVRIAYNAKKAAAQ